jgi:hypothetical protein
MMFVPVCITLKTIVVYREPPAFSVVASADLDVIAFWELSRVEFWVLCVLDWRVFY